jgi:hypothetical protein
MRKFTSDNLLHNSSTIIVIRYPPKSSLLYSTERTTVKVKEKREVKVHRAGAVLIVIDLQGAEEMKTGVHRVMTLKKVMDHLLEAKLPMLITSNIRLAQT